MRPRENPFAVERLRELPGYLLNGITWESLLARLEAQGWRGAIVGPEGHGKSTLMRALARRLEHAGWATGWVQLREDRRGLSAADRAEVARLRRERGLLCIDGAEQLGWAAWQWLRWQSRSCGGLLVTSHAPGLLPTLYSCQTSPDLLAALVEELTRNRPLAPPVDLERLFHHHDGNVRNALRELYDICAER